MIKTNAKTKKTMRLRSKLIGLFISIKVLPLVLLAWLAWLQSEKLVDILTSHYKEFELASRESLQQVGDQAIDDSMSSLEKRVRSEIERLTTDTAKQIAHFLYSRDDDIKLAAVQDPSVEVYKRFLQHRNAMSPKKYTWEFNKELNEWMQTTETSHRSSNPVLANNDKQSTDVLPENSRAYNTRPPETTNQFVQRPLYYEMTFVSTDGQELVKVTTSDVVSSSLKNVSDSHNTFVKAESYFTELKSLEPGEIYVSDVIGAYVPTHFIGNYTPKKAAKEGIDFAPENSAYAGKENPVGKRFKGIVRWATPVVKENQIIGYVTLALNHDHLMNMTDGVMPTDQRYTTFPDPSEGNYAFIWDHLGRSIAHPRHYFITGYDPITGLPQTPWLEQKVYNEWQESGLPFKDYSEQALTFQNQSLERSPAKQMGATGLRGLDCRFLNFAPQCKGWYDLTKHGGSGSFIIFWSGLWKLVTAAAIPYYTGQYGESKRGFGIVTVGTNIGEFYQPARESEAKIGQLIIQNGEIITSQAESGNKAITASLLHTAQSIGYSTLVMIILVVLIAIWVASYFSNRIVRLVNGINQFQRKGRQFRFKPEKGDEISQLATAFDDMADTVDKHMNQLEQEVDRRKSSEGKLLELKDELEIKVQERTKELTQEIQFRERAQERVKYLAEHDELTELPNRRGFGRKLVNALSLAKEQDHKVVLLLIDLDGFKEVNDSMGHDVGDKLLCFIAKLLSDTTRDTDAVVRLGGDEFAIIMGNIDSISIVSKIIKRILSRLNAPVFIDDHQIKTGVSIGGTIYPDNAQDKETMLHQADLALYQAKEWGGLACHFYDKNLQQQSEFQASMEKQIVRAMNNEELELYFQPCFNYRTNEVEGMEALLRLNHSEQGVLEPSHFLDVARRSGLKHQIDTWLLRSLCMQACEWISDGIEFGRLSFNVYAADLCKSGYAQYICETLDLLGVPGTRIAIEVMENEAITNFESYAENINQLRAYNIFIMLDDLGTEHSSLQRMLETEADIIKIDQYFIQRIGDKRIETVIIALIGFGKDLDFLVLAEGVETQEQLDFLMQHGCYLIQGYIHAHPMSSTDVKSYLQKHSHAV